MRVLRNVLCVITVLLSSGSAFAQFADIKVAQSHDERLLNVAFPASILGHEYGAQLEFNLGGSASIAFAYIHMQKGEELSDKDITEKHRSLMTDGQEFAIQMARYSENGQMAGFYYGLSAGYRMVNAVWKKLPDSQYGIIADEVIDDEGRLQHKLQGTGTTGRARLGYRYIPASWPLLMGGFIGLRHYDAHFEDRKSKDSIETTKEEKAELRRFFMTRPELGAEIGISF